MALISIQALIEKAEANGYKVEKNGVGGGHTSYALWKPTHTGPDAVWHDGSQYSTCDHVVNDHCSLGYGYNCLFYGPWHFGYVQSDSYKHLIEEMN